MAGPSLKIIADANIPLLDETFGQHGEVIRVPGRELSPTQLSDAHVLLVRSVTPVGAKLLRGSSVRFVGTATIGTDHMDTAWLEQHGISWASAPGCNADAAAQYTLGMILLAFHRLGKDIGTQSVGIIGRGNVGSRLQQLLDALNVVSVACDPPLAESGTRNLVELDEALDQDIVSLHVPLTRDGPHPTFHMLNRERLADMRDGALLVNAARGDVVEAKALLDELQSGRLFAALDTWPGEPSINTAMLEACTVASPHVAGYSVEGRRNGTLAIYQQFCSATGHQDAAGNLLKQGLAKLEFAAGPGSPFEITASAVIDTCGIERDDAAMRCLGRSDNPAAQFDALRRDYPLRREFAAWRVHCNDEHTRRILAAMGFSVKA